MMKKCYCLSEVKSPTLYSVGFLERDILLIVKNLETFQHFHLRYHG